MSDKGKPVAKSKASGSPSAQAKPETVRMRVFVDAIDEGVARLLLGTRAFEVPAALLAPGTREGNWIELAVTIVPPPPDDTEARRARAIEGDPGGDIKL